MTPEMPRISPEEKLRLVRELDVFHPWESLDEMRYCRRCDATFSGHQIRVVLGPDGASHRLECPTEDCPSVPIEWIMMQPHGKTTPIQPPSRDNASQISPPVRHPQYRPGLFGFLRVPQNYFL